MRRSSHARSESFGDFVTADASTTEHQDDSIIDLRHVERKLDEDRHAQIAEAISAESAMPVPVPHATTHIDLRPIEEKPLHSAPDMPASTSSTGSSSYWSTSLWNKLSALSAFAGDAASPPTPHRHKPRRSHSVVRSRTAPSAISGAPGFDPTATPHWNHGHWSFDSAGERRREQLPIPVQLKGRREDTDIVIEAWHAARIHAQVPRRLRLGKSWSLLYSLDQHGASLSTLYSRVDRAMNPGRREQGPAEAWLRGSSAAAQQAVLGTSLHVGGGVDMSNAGIVIAVRDTDDNVFGAFVNEALHISPHYYGNGECFLWKTVQRLLPVPPEETDGEASVEDDLHPDKAIEVFRWTGKNDYMVLTESDFLSVGGGDGHYGLWFDDALNKGVSAQCPAFDNQVLCNAQESKALHAAEGGGNAPPVDLLDDLIDKPHTPEQGKFQCLGVEVWAVGLD
ncbi:oxidation resistance protein 1 [Malassezia pachydermatis]